MIDKDLYIELLQTEVKRLRLNARLAESEARIAYRNKDDARGAGQLMGVSAAEAAEQLDKGHSFQPTRNLASVPVEGEPS